MASNNPISRKEATEIKIVIMQVYNSSSNKTNSKNNNNDNNSNEYNNNNNDNNNNNNNRNSSLYRTQQNKDNGNLRMAIYCCSTKFKASRDATNCNICSARFLTWKNHLRNLELINEWSE